MRTRCLSKADAVKLCLTRGLSDAVASGIDRVSVFDTPVWFCYAPAGASAPWAWCTLNNPSFRFMVPLICLLSSN